MFSVRRLLGKPQFQGVLLIVLFCLGGMIRMANHKSVFENYVGHLNFFDPDSYYQLRKLIYFLENFPSNLYFDPLIYWPKGDHVDWSEGLTFLVGVPLKLLGVSGYRELELYSSFAMILLGLGLSYLVWMLIKRLRITTCEKFLMIGLVLFSVGLIRFSCLGQIDHHILEPIFIVSIILLTLKWFEDNRPWAKYLLAIILFYALTVSSSIVFGMGLFYALVAVFYKKELVWKDFALFHLAWLVLLGPYIYYRISMSGDFLSRTHASLFHISLIVVLALGCLIYHRSKKIFGCVTGALLLALFAHYFFDLKWGPFLAMQDVIAYVFARTGALQQVIEAQPVFLRFGKLDLDFMHNNLGYVAYLLPFMLLLPLLRKDKYNRLEKILFFSLFILSFPAISQKRFLHIMLPVFLVCLAVSLEFVRSCVNRWGIQKTYPALLVLFTALMLAPPVQFGFTPSLVSAHRVDLIILRAFLDDQKISDEEAWSRLATNSKSAKGLWVNPNMGHLYQYTTGYGVTANSFYGNKVLKEDLELRTIQSNEEFKAKLIENKIDFIFAVNDFQYFEFLHRTLGRDSSQFYQEQDGQINFNLNELEKFAWARILLQQEYPKYLFQIYALKIPERHFYNAARVFEVRVKDSSEF